MTGEIKVGMSFGTYDGMIEELKGNCITDKKDYSAQTDYESEYVFRDKYTGIFKNGYRENIRHNDKGVSLFSNSVIFNGEYQHGTTAKTEKDLNKFDYIQGESQFALDIDGDGKVNENEIFDGKIDYHIYKKAKESGSLGNYQSLLKTYKY